MAVRAINAGAPAVGGDLRARLRAVYERVFITYWAYWAALLAAAVLNIFEFGFGNSAWGVTTEFTRWGGHLLGLAGVDVSGWEYYKQIGFKGMPWERGAGWINIGMFVGALIGTLLSTSFKIRMPQQKRRLVQGFAGGVLAGFGARLAMGCNLGAFFSAIPQFSLHGYLFAAGLVGGTYLGTRLALLPWMAGRPAARRRSVRPAAAAPSRRSLQPALGWGLAAAVLGLLAFQSLIGQGKLGIWMLIGVGFGLIIERGRICFTSAFRELWITRQGDMARALATSMAVAAVGIALLSAGNEKLVARAEWASPGVLLGGLIFGVGIVLAGGCETGWMYRSTQGYVQLWMAGLGTVVGTTLLAWGWEHWGLYTTLVAGWPQVSLYKELGWGGAIVITLGALALWWLAVTWWEGRGTMRAPAVQAETLRPEFATDGSAAGD